MTSSHFFSLKLVELKKVDELYIEVLYTILHMIGCDAEKDEQAVLVGHLKEAFHIDNTKHEQDERGFKRGFLL